MFTFQNRMLLFWSVGLIATKICERKTEKVVIIVVFTIATSQYNTKTGLSHTHNARFCYLFKIADKHLIYVYTENSPLPPESGVAGSYR